VGSCSQATFVRVVKFSQEVFKWHRRRHPTPHIPSLHPTCLPWYSPFLSNIPRWVRQSRVPQSVLHPNVGIHGVGATLHVDMGVMNVRDGIRLFSNHCPPRPVMQDISLELGVL